MAFNSYEFLFLFMPATVAGFFLLLRFASCKAAIRWLIFASIVFYSQASFRSLIVIAPSIVIDYLIALALLRNPSRKRFRAFLLSAGIASNILFLGYFKYANFFLDTADTIFGAHSDPLKLIVPLGLSFITFQKIAFLADVHSGEIRSVNFPDYLIFILFFPRIIAGPIVHYQGFVPQLTNVRPGDAPTNAVIGGCLFSMGLFKKAVIADSLTSYVAPTFDHPWYLLSVPPTLLTTWIGVLAYTFQLYFDFSGYSDMALGLARIFGVRLPMNFNSPLRATNIVEFWSRWHITLTRFLTAYIYNPISLRLTRSQMAKGKLMLRGKYSTFPAITVLIGIPTIVTMLASGLWHGAGWQFLAWGALHGLYLVINQGWRILRPRFWADQASYHRIMKPLGFLLTFTAVVVALVFFRAPSVTSALTILGGMFGMNGVLPHDVQLLGHLGVPLSWDIVQLYQPFSSIVWIIVLFIAVVFLPNSLEIMRRFQPALDFPQDQGRSTNGASLPMVSEQRGGTDEPLSVRLRSMLSTIGRIKREGLTLSPMLVAVVALMLVLGVASMSRGGAFIYGQF